MVNELVQAITERIMFIPNLKKVGTISRVEAHIITKLTRQLQNLVLKFV